MLQGAASTNLIPALQLNSSPPPERVAPFTWSLRRPQKSSINLCYLRLTDIFPHCLAHFPQAEKELPAAPCSSSSMLVAKPSGFSMGAAHGYRVACFPDSLWLHVSTALNPGLGLGWQELVEASLQHSPPQMKMQREATGQHHHVSLPPSSMLPLLQVQPPAPQHRDRTQVS